MFTTSDISVVIPSYNSRKTIEACLGSLTAQESAPLEIIIVDSSTDDTPEIVRQRFPDVRLHQMAGRTFPGPARNLGASLARGAIVAFIDSDCIAEPDWLRRMVACHSEGYRVVGGSIGVGNPASSIAWAGHLCEFREYLPTSKPRYTSHVPTCNISYRRELFQSRGGFPNAYYPQEDMLFNYALSMEGVQVWFDPAIHVRHFCREELREFLSHQHRFGRVTRCTLRRLDLPGASIARREHLAWLASPVLGTLKFLRTTQAFMSNFPRVALRYPGVLALLAVGMVWWTRGFAAGARTGLSGIRGWTDPGEPILALLTSPRAAPEQER